MMKLKTHSGKQTKSSDTSNLKSLNNNAVERRSSIVINLEVTYNYGRMRRQVDLGKEMKNKMRTLESNAW